MRVAAVVLTASIASAQGLDPATLRLFTRPPNTWGTYNGDYSGRRFADIAQVNPGNVGALSLKWMHRVNSVGQQRGVGAPTIKSTPLVVDGVMYFTIPDHVWAIDARTGEEIWHYAWADQGGHLVGNRGVGMYRNWLYFLAPDGWFISLNAKDGKERWRKKIADEKMQYFTTMAAMVVKNHIIVGVGGDAMDVPGYLEARDPETGELQWRWWTSPRPGEPGSETWPTKNAMEHGGGMTWLPGTYDPELNLLYWGTGNPNPVYAGQSRAGSNLWTCSIVALNPDTGKLVWYFQASPHDTHDWDNVETPVLFDGVFAGKPRKMLAQAARNGYFFVLDRTTGEGLVSTGFVGVNWSKGLDAKGQPVPDAKKEPRPDGSLINTPGGGGTNWMPPSFSPRTGLFYVQAREGYSLAYLIDTDDEPSGYGGSGATVYSRGLLKAIDYQTGKTRWQHAWPSEGGGGLGGAGILTTSSDLLFTGDPSGNLIAFDAANGKILWHFRMASPLTNGPITYMLGEKQYVVCGAGDTLYTFALLP